MRHVYRMAISYWKLLTYSIRFSLSCERSPPMCHSCMFIIMWWLPLVLMFVCYSQQVWFNLFSTFHTHRINFHFFRKKKNEKFISNCSNSMWIISVFWCGLGGQGIMLGYLNTFVHAVMYTYYLLSIWMPQVKSSNLIKQNITRLQMVYWISYRRILLFFFCFWIETISATNRKLSIEFMFWFFVWISFHPFVDMILIRYEFLIDFSFYTPPSHLYYLPFTGPVYYTDRTFRTWFHHTGP